MKLIALSLTLLGTLALTGCGGECCRPDTKKAHADAAREADKAFTKDVPPATEPAK
ncbi:MAG: hypothetical protein AAB263_09155 [Planctomycetota bacterium]